MTKRVVIWVLVLLLAVPLQAFADLTLEEERKLGKEAFEQVQKQLPMVTDPDCVSYLRKLGSELSAQLKDNRFEFKFYLIDEGELNAFALPDGYIFMFRGLVSQMESEGELVAVLAHEMSHVHFRHIANRMAQQSKLTGLAVAGMVAGLLLGAVTGSGSLGQAAVAGATAGATQAALAYSREDEMQADFGGYKLMTAVGYDPNEMEVTFGRLWRLERTQYGTVPPYLLTHPTSNARMEFVQNMVRRHDSKITRTDNTEFKRIKTRLIALYAIEDSAEQQFENMLNEKTDPLNAHYGMALIKMRQGRYNLAINELDKITGEPAKESWYLRDKGVCYLGMGQDQQAQFYLNQALVLTPGDQQTLLSLGQSLTRQDRLDEAAFTLRRLLDMNQDLPQAHYDLGVALGKMGNTGEASLHLGLAFKGQKNMKMAQYHLERAVRDLRGQPQLQAQAQKALEQIKKDEEERKNPDKAKDKDKDKDKDKKS